MDLVPSTPAIPSGARFSSTQAGNLQASTLKESKGTSFVTCLALAETDVNPMRVVPIVEQLAEPLE